MSAKDCGSHGKRRRRICRRLFAALLIALFLILLTILIVWAVLQPKKPKFILQDATIYTLTTETSTVNTSFQVTISARNPNDRIGIYYDRVEIYAVYKNQQITFRTTIPPTYEDKKETNVWSPFIYGGSVPVAPYNALALNQDKESGVVMLMIKIDGRVRFKVGSFTTGKYNLHVKCPALIQIGTSSSGVVANAYNGVKYQLTTRCSVSV